ncbi:MraY family glycosyltransferase [Acidothermaceae bacterium B102]|nr:MraY family glycosyltransferase [Acidothermaceae bacterium B102]
MREYALVLMLALLVTYLLTPVTRRIAIAAGALAKVRDRDVHAIATPRWGGLAILGGLAAGLLGARHLPALSHVFAGGSQSASAPPSAILSGAAVICLVGAIDDRWELDALTKLAGQILAAGVTVLGGVQLYFVPLPHHVYSLSPEVSAPITILFIVVTINAVNFIDGLDGLAAGVVAIAALAFFAYSYQLSNYDHLSVMATPTLITAVLAGSCLGFLPHNFNPARVFMGDSGSMLIGLVLGSASITITGSLAPDQVLSLNVGTAFLPLLLPLAVLAVPLVDLAMAVLRRLVAGRSPFSPDKSHLHHRLLEIGHSQTRAVLIMYFWAALVGSAVVALAFTGGRLAVATVAGSVAVVALLVSNIPRLRAARRR